MSFFQHVSSAVASSIRATNVTKGERPILDNLKYPQGKHFKASFSWVKKIIKSTAFPLRDGLGLKCWFLIWTYLIPSWTWEAILETDLCYWCFPVTKSSPIHGLQHARLPCPSLSLGVCSNSCPLSQWCLPAISFLCCPILLLPSNLSCFRFFSSESALGFRWSKYCSFSINASSEYSGLISFRIDWLDLLAVQGTLKSLLQHRNSKASILQCLAFFMV